MKSFKPEDFDFSKTGLSLGSDNKILAEVANAKSSARGNEFTDLSNLANTNCPLYLNLKKT